MYKVIIAEDEDLIRKGLMYSINWAELDCSIVADVKNGTEGIDAIKAHSPDIVLADINMPVMAGLEMIRRTHEEYDYSSIIISGYSSFDYAQKAIELGVLGYLTKPLDIRELKEAVQKAKKECDLRLVVQKNLVDKIELKKIDLFKDTYRSYDANLVVNQMLQYIYKNYQQKVTMREIIKELNYSETYLNRKFKDAVGTTFNEYLNRYRIQKAVEFLVEDPTKSIIEIASSCGIGDYKYFGSVFKKYIGCSPKDYLQKIY